MAKSPSDMTMRDRYLNKVVLFDPDGKSRYRNDWIQPAKCTAVTPKPDQNGIPDAELRVVGASNKTKWIRVIDNHAIPFETWGEAMDHLATRQPDSPYLKHIKPRMINERLYRHDPKTT